MEAHFRASLTLTLISITLFASVSSLPFFFECGQITQAIVHETPSRLSIIKSPAFPGHYRANSICTYRVQRTSGSVCAATFLFNLLDLEESESCRKDFIEINGEKICGSKDVGFSKTVAFGNSHEIALKFVSDNDTAGLGFLITVMQQSCPHIGQCGQVLFSSHRFAITSPDYPLAYKNNKNCKYVIIKQNPRICKLRLIVRSFDVEYQAHCDSDYLQLADGNRLCGYQEPGQIIEQTFHGDQLEMEFVSNFEFTREGFYVDVFQIACGHHQTHHVKHFNHTLH